MEFLFNGQKQITMNNEENKDRKIIKNKDSFLRVEVTKNNKYKAKKEK